MSHPLTLYREKHKLTLEAFGLIIGVTKSAVLKWESGAVPRKKLRERIAEVTDGNVTWGFSSQGAGESEAA